MTAQDPTKPAGDKPSVRMITVPADRAGQRLDNFLLGQLKGAPRSLVYKLVRSGQVRVNGGRAKAERKLEAGDEVRVPPVRLSEEGDKAGPPEAFMRRLEQAIVFEDARLLALNKPSGWPAMVAVASASARSRPCARCVPGRPWNWSTGWIATLRAC